MTRLRKAVELATSEAVTAEALAELGAADVKKLVGELDQQIAALAELKEKVSKVADDADSSE